MNETIEKLQGETVFYVVTRSDEDAEAQLMMLTGQFLNMLEHAARYHHRTVTPGYLWSLFDDLGHLAAKYQFPEPSEAES